MCNRSLASRSCVQDVRGGSEVKGPVCKASSKENQSVAQNPLNSEVGRGTLYGSGIFHGSERLTENSLANSLSNADGNCSSPSSSIGANSSCTSVEDSLSGTPDEEVESRLRSPLEGMASLGTFLPPRKGLSRFIEGKSRSFTCLADIRSIKDLAKAENPYARRRRFSNHSIDTLERSRCLPPRNSACGISKKSLCSSRTNLALALVMSSKEKGTEDENWDPCRLSRGIAERSTPRSFSMADLQKTGFTFPASKTL
ncbi:hypothetical protein O6H91_01G099500 [Diphasiastrum complanatum]|uniref:Uncharacterized protein n=1 Tax=Diphasiastrum complanatum TaxID=34168 RepID=A0ACC2ETU2_DIPCM|nr:hypothetical protein O6H91_01G099500 [Diphasiastrum complanatum]